MRGVILLTLLFIATAIAQWALIPSFLPPVLRPDLGLLLAFLVMAFAGAEAGLWCLFIMGLQADLLGSARMGLATLSALLAGGLLQLLAGRGLIRSDLFSAGLFTLMGVLAAHVFYALLGRAVGVGMTWGQTFASLAALAIASTVWALPCALLTGRVLYLTGLMAEPARERWAEQDRQAKARRKKVARA